MECVGISVGTSSNCRGIKPKSIIHLVNTRTSEAIVVTCVVLSIVVIIIAVLVILVIVIVIVEDCVCY